MRIVAGRWRGRRLAAPAGSATRPTAERLRQALFDMLLHAPWGGRAALEGATVLDLFAGTGALGLEALSRGAARCTFHETDPAALRALAANIAACGAQPRAELRAADASLPGPGPVADLVFIDPPYGRHLAGAALAGLAAAGRLAASTLVACELGRDDPDPALACRLAGRAHGAGRVLIGHPRVETGPTR